MTSFTSFNSHECIQIFMSLVQGTKLWDHEKLISRWPLCLRYAIWSEVMADFRPSATSKKGGGGLKPCKAVATTGNGFANATSIHGISYIFDNSLLVLERILWFIVVGIFVGLCAHFIVDAYLDWQRNPIITSVSSTGRFTLQNLF